MEPLFESNSMAARRKSTNLVESHTQLLVSRTWQKVLLARQDQAERAQLEASSRTTTRASTTANATTTKPAKTLTTSSSLPSNIPTSGRLHEWYQQQQASVIASHERALIDAARQRQKPPTPPLSLNLSMQHELGMEQALEQEVADRQAEEEADAWGATEEEKHPEVPQGEPSESNRDQDNTTNSQDADATDSQQLQQPQASSDHGNSASSEPTQETAFFTPREADSNPQSVAPNNDSQCLDRVEEQQSLLSTAESFDTANTSGAGATGETATRTNANVTTAETTTTTTLEKKDCNNGDDANSSDDETVGIDEPDDSDDEETVGEEEDMETDAAIPQQQPAATDRNTEVTMGQPTMSVTTTNDDNTSSSYAAPTPRQSNTASRMNLSDNTRTDNGEHESTGRKDDSVDREAAAAFQVGDIVQVQSRTWPGVNKPGGIARIAKVLPDSSSYHVNYILGGREKNVDGLFISLPPEEMTVQDDAPTANDEDNDNRDTCFSSTSRERKSRRISTQQQQHEQQQQETKVKLELELPPELMKQLASEGFDVTPRAGTSATTGNCNNNHTGGRVGGRVRIKVEGESAASRRSQSETRRTKQETAAARRTQSEGRGWSRRGRPSAKKDPVLQATTVNKQEKKDAQKRNATTDSPGANKKATTKPPSNKRRKIVPQETAPSVTDDESPPLPESSQEICALANAHYQQRVQAALGNSSVCIVASGLSEDDKAALKSLCRHSKKQGTGMFLVVLCSILIPPDMRSPRHANLSIVFATSSIETK